MLKTARSLLKKEAPIFLVGEALGADEEAVGLPFVGAAGKLLDHILSLAGIDREACSISNVFQVRPPRNDVTWFFGARKEHAAGNPFPAYKGKFLRKEWWQQVETLYDEIAEIQPKLIVCLGGTALWALVGEDKITDHRGTLLESSHGNVLPTFHPAAVLRDYSLRPIIISDLDRARRFVSSRLQVVPKEIKVPQTLNDIEDMFKALKAVDLIAVDVETEEQQITCIALSPNPSLSFVVPIFAKHESDWSAWPFDTEVYFWHELYGLAQSKRFLFHNCTYDLTYLREYGIIPRYCPHDTMLLHHACQPELKKSLGFMASMYLDNPSWKWMRMKALKDINKRDE